MDKICCVYTCNSPYFNDFKISANQLLTNGKFGGDIVLIIGDDLETETINNDEFINSNNIIVKKFKNITFHIETNTKLESIKVDGRNINKKFQWHKLHVFDVFFKNWDYVFYLDCGMKIHGDIDKILKTRKEGCLVAQSDNYPNNGWDLAIQFDKTDPIFNTLNQKYSLNIDYPQTGIMLFDTKIISDNLINNLINLTCEFPITRTNEQAIIALYFTNIEKRWVLIPIGDEETYYYSSFRIHNDKNYIISRYN
jgi:hypothetical protein